MEGQTINIQAIINPISGVGSKRKIPKMIETAFAGENCCVEISFTEYPGHASELTRQALDKGANCVIAVGGDGTVNEIARAMLRSDAVLGIIPKGSGNGLARELAYSDGCTPGDRPDHKGARHRQSELMQGERTYLFLYLRSRFRCGGQPEVCR